MNYYILDLYIIIQYPQLIYYSHPEFKIYISEHYFDKDLIRFDSRIPKHNLIDFLNSAKSLGVINCYTGEAIPDKRVLPPNLSNYINLYTVLNEQYDKLKLVDDNISIAIVSKDLRFSDRMMSPQMAIKKMTEKGGHENLELKEMSKNIGDEVITAHLKYLVIFAFIIAVFSIKNFTKLIKSDLLIGSILVSTSFIAVWFLFTLRAKRRLWYGALEVMIGLITTVYVIFFSNGFKLTDFDYLKICSAIYITIRGLDNVEKGITETKNSHFFTIWKKIF